MPLTIFLWIATILCAQTALGYWRAWGSFVAYPAPSGGPYGYSLPPWLVFIVGNIFVLLPTFVAFGAALITCYFARQHTKSNPSSTTHKISNALGIFLGVWFVLLLVVMVGGKSTLPAFFKFPW